MNLSIKNSDVVIEKKSTGYSVKIKNIKNSRLCNIFEKDGLYKVKC